MPSGLLTLFSITGDNLSPSPEGMKSLILPFEFVVFLGYVVLFTSCMGCYLIIRWFEMIDPLTHMSTCPRGEVNLTQTPGLPIPPCLNRSLCLVLNKNTKLIHFYMPVESRATKSFSSLLPKKKKKKDRSPVWKVLYKPPWRKHSGDLQCRILHGAVAVNAFVSIINPNVRGLWENVLIAL